MTVKTIDRVEKLVRLTSSPVEHEAALAAAHACRLLREHGLKVIDPAVWEAVVVELQATKQEVTSLQRTLQHARNDLQRAHDEAARIIADWRSRADEDFRQLYRLGNEVTALRAELQRRVTAAPPSKPSAPSTPPPQRRGRARLIKSKFAGQCRACAGGYLTDEQVYWVKGAGCWHIACVRATKMPEAFEGDSLE